MYAHFRKSPFLTLSGNTINIFRHCPTPQTTHTTMLCPCTVGTLINHSTISPFNNLHPPAHTHICTFPILRSLRAYSNYPPEKMMTPCKNPSSSPKHPLTPPKPQAASAAKEQQKN